MEQEANRLTKVRLNRDLSHNPSHCNTLVQKAISIAEIWRTGEGGHAGSETHPRDRDPSRPVPQRPPPGRPLHEGQAPSGLQLSVAELDEGLVWNRATLGIATISSSTAYLTGQNQEIDRAAHRIARTPSAPKSLDSYVEILLRTEIQQNGPHFPPQPTCRPHRRHRPF